MENHPQHLPGLPEPFLMIAIPGGTFDMGGESWDNERTLPIHPVELSAFRMGQYPVTQALWMAVMGENNNPSYFKGLTRPVETVSWEQIDREFLPRLNEMTKGKRPADTVYRLPTEAEWEYAARGGPEWGNQSFLYAGSGVLDEVGWYDGNSQDETKPVGLKMKNSLGLYDMSGNVWEWCADWYGSDYYKKRLEEGIVKNPPGPEQGAHRVLRGGSWSVSTPYCRSMGRTGTVPSIRDALIGFRLVLSISPV